MGTRMLLFPGEEHMHRAPSSSWGGMHDPDVGNPPWMMSGYSQSSGGNTWSKRLAANSSNNSSSTTNNNNNSDSDSWEVRAFAEDASTSGHWPPRSYSCSFCQREFRTAQALGGHMNVHRRERAQANQLAQLRSSGTEGHYPNNNNNLMINGNPSSIPPLDHGHWLPLDSTTHVVDHHQYGSPSNPYDRYASSAVVDDSYLHSASYGAPSSYGAPTSYGAPSSPSFRNSDPYEYRSSFDTPPRGGDSGLDLELRLGQRYD